MDLTIIILAMSVTVLLALLYLRIGFRRAQTGAFLPDFYLFGILLYALGSTFIYLIEENSKAIDLVVMSWVSLDSAILGSIVFIVLFGNHYRRFSFNRYVHGFGTTSIEKSAVYFGLIVSVLVCIAFMYFVFSNEVVGALFSSISMSGESSLLDARKAITSGSEGYFAPGFVKQFRDNLIPIFLIALMAINSKQEGVRYYKLIFVCVVLVALTAMAIAGVRSNIVLFLLSLFVARSYIIKSGAQLGAKRRGLGKGSVLLSIFLVLLFYGLLTAFLGRAKEGDSLLVTALNIVPNLLQRVFLAAPAENIITYSYWGTIGPTFGQSWLNDLSSILPGVSPSGLSNQLHYLRGGSEQGNSPLGLPADVWFAWGWVGILLVPLIYSIVLGVFDMLLLSRSSPLFFGAKMFMIFALLKIYSPFGFLLYGGGAVGILIVFVTVVRASKYKFGGDREHLGVTFIGTR